MVSEDPRTKGNAAYSASPHHTLDDVRVCPAWRGRERRGPERVSRSEIIRNMKVLYIPNLPAQLRRRGRGQKLEARGWYRNPE